MLSDQLCSFAPRTSSAASDLTALTGLRFVAAMLVVLYHFARLPWPGWAAPLRHVIGAGFVSVSLFFVLSGFILAYTYLTPGEGMRGTRRNFWVSRFARIAPAYALGFALIAPANIATSMHVNEFGPAMEKLAIHAVAALSLLQAWTPQTAWSWNYPAWSVSVEVFFYLVFPWIGPWLARLRPARALTVGVGLWVVSMMAPVALLLVRGVTGPPGPGDTLAMGVEFTPLLRLPEFAIGILLGSAFRRGQFERLRGRYVVLLPIVMIAAVLVGSPWVPHILLACGVLTPLFALLLVTLAQDCGAVGAGLSSRPMLLLGEASYGIYILQVPVAAVVGWLPPLYSGVRLTMFCALLVAFALMTFRLVEAPARLRLKRWMGERKDLEVRHRRDRLVPSGQRAVYTRRALLAGTASMAAAAAAASVVRPLAQVAVGDDGSATAAMAATWVTSTKDAPWQWGTLLPAARHWNSLALEVAVDRPQQVIEGFGGCLHEFGWLALQALEPLDRAAVLRELFEPGRGASFNLCRMPMGANDFVTEWYSCDDVAGDLELAHFSIDRDRAGVLPFIKAAQQHNPGLRLWAVPWSPPAWMKRNGFYAEAVPTPGEPATGIRRDQLGREGETMFREEDAFFRSYARYFGRFVDAYRAEGVPIGMVMPQNEWNSPHPFPSCTWTAGTLVRLLEHLGPEMEARDVEVFLGTLERADPELVNAVLRRPEARRYVRGLGAQWDGRAALQALHAEHPKLRLYATEQECGDGRNRWRAVPYCWNMMRENFEFGTSAYMYWNLALVPDGESHRGEFQNSLVTVDPATRSYRFNPEYYLLKHVSHFVQVGARYLPTSGVLNDSLAFRNPDGSMVVAVRNQLGVERAVHVRAGHRTVNVSLPANSINTLVLPATA